jgi:hypothetical protein
LVSADTLTLLAASAALNALNTKICLISLIAVLPLAVQTTH